MRTESQWLVHQGASEVGFGNRQQPGTRKISAHPAVMVVWLQKNEGGTIGLLKRWIEKDPLAPDCSLMVVEAQ